MMKSTKVIIFGCKSTTFFLYNSIKDYYENLSIITIDKSKGDSNHVADYFEFKGKIENNIFHSKSYSLNTKSDLNFFKENSFDLGFVMGWQRLIPENILNTFKIGVFGMHGSSLDLPFGRGRSPMNWSIIEGREVFYTNLFKYDKGIDSGKILDTYKFQITKSDTAETLHYKNLLSMRYLILKNFQSAKKIQLRPQKNGTPTYYPKRSESDSLIDWTDDINNIEKLIRAVSKPFNGAYTFNKSKKIIIHRAAIFDFKDFGFKEVKPGAVIAVFPNNKFLVSAMGGILIVHEYESDFKLEKGIIFGNNNEKKKYFPVNKLGFYDI